MAYIATIAVPRVVAHGAAVHDDAFHGAGRHPGNHILQAFQPLCS